MSKKAQEGEVIMKRKRVEKHCSRLYIPVT